MDYVVYGTGYGATLMLLGYAVRTWGPGWRFRDGDAAAYDRREFRTARSAWTRFTTGLGAVIATAGAVLVLLTFLLMLINPGDGIGSTIALSVTGLLLVAIAVWAWLFFSRFGPWGIVAMPDALSSYQPAHYDSRAAKASPVPAQSSSQDADEPVFDEEEPSDEEDADVLDDDDAEFAARYSKFELHHPESEEEAEVEEAPVIEDEGRFEAQYSKYDSHHPDAEPAAGADGDDETEPIEQYLDTLTPEDVSDDVVDAADEEPVGDSGPDAPIETYEDLVSHGKARDEIVDADVDDPLEVLPEAHDDAADPTEPEDGGREESREEASGREEALRRLRERQARRAQQQRPDDDA